MNTKTLFQQALTLCLVGTFGILGAACGSENDDCPSGEIRSGGECVPVEDDAGQDMGQDMGPTACEQAQSCIDENCGTFEQGDDAGQYATCLQDNCQDAIGSCSQTTGQPCGEFISCYVQCDSDSCRQQCQQNANVIDLYHGFDRLTCLNENECPALGGRCEIENCSESYYTCRPERSPGDASCGEIFRCQSLGLGECSSNGTKQAQIRQAEVIGCGRDAGCLEDSEADPISCLMAQCSDETNTCGFAGESSCKEALGCVNTRASQSAATECIADLSAGDSASNFNSLQSCLSTECGDASSRAERVTCAATNCSEERGTCGLSGTSQTCSDMWNCAQGNISECMNAENPGIYLYTNYVYAGPSEDQANFEALRTCVSNNCPDAESSCVESQCGEEATACGIGSSN